MNGYSIPTLVFLVIVIPIPKGMTIPCAKRALSIKMQLKAVLL